jgi:hypothetical protein
MPSHSHAVFVIALALAVQSASAEPISSAGLRSGVCEREGATLVGEKPARVSGKVHGPKKIHDAAVKFPELPPGITGRGNWIGEALLDARGNVAHVWAIREVDVTPGFPAFNKAIRETIQQWKYEPIRLEGKPIPACVTVTVMINWH